MFLGFVEQLSKVQRIKGLAAKKCMMGIALMTVSLLASCGGGSSGGTATGAITGTFADAEVSGLTYITGGITSTTNALGEYQCVVGDNISFYLADTLIGSTTCSAVSTPIDLVLGAVDENNVTVGNIVQFLVSLDLDTDPNNGIQLPNLKSISLGKVNFALSATAFATDANVLKILGRLTNRLFLIDRAYALDHFRSTLTKYGKRPSDVVEYTNTGDPNIKSLFINTRTGSNVAVTIDPITGAFNGAVFASGKGESSVVTLNTNNQLSSISNGMYIIVFSNYKAISNLSTTADITLYSLFDGTIITSFQGLNFSNNLVGNKLGVFGAIVASQCSNGFCTARELVQNVNSMVSKVNNVLSLNKIPTAKEAGQKIVLEVLKGVGQDNSVSAITKGIANGVALAASVAGCATTKSVVGCGQAALDVASSYLQMADLAVQSVKIVLTDNITYTGSKNLSYFSKKLTSTGLQSTLTVNGLAVVNGTTIAPNGFGIKEWRWLCSRTIRSRPQVKDIKLGCPNGFPLLGKNQTINFINEGEYRINMVATTTGGLPLTSGSIVVKVAPLDSAFTVSPITKPFPMVVTFNKIKPLPVNSTDKLLWRFSDGQTLANASSGQFSISVPGTLSLTITNAARQSSTTTQVISPPKAGGMTFTSKYVRSYEFAVLVDPCGNRITELSPVATCQGYTSSATASNGGLGRNGFFNTMSITWGNIGAPSGRYAVSIFQQPNAVQPSSGATANFTSNANGTVIASGQVGIAYRSPLTQRFLIP